MDRTDLYDKYEIYHYEIGDIREPQTIETIPLYDYNNGVPNSYMVVDYIGMNGTQWLETTIPFSQNIEAHMIVSCDNVGGTHQVIARKNGSYNQYQFSFYTYGYSASPGGSYDKTNIGFTNGVVYDVLYNTDGNKVLVNGIEYHTAGTNTGSGTEPLVLGIRGSGICMFHGRYYSVVLRDKSTNEIVCALVPCYRRTDGVPGMYDTVNKLFLENKGTGSLSYG